MGALLTIVVIAGIVLLSLASSYYETIPEGCVGVVTVFGRYRRI